MPIGSSSQQHPARTEGGREKQSRSAIEDRPARPHSPTRKASFHHDRPGLAPAFWWQRPSPCCRRPVRPSADHKGGGGSSASRPQHATAARFARHVDALSRLSPPSEEFIRRGGQRGWSKCRSAMCRRFGCGRGKGSKPSLAAEARRPLPSAGGSGGASASWRLGQHLLAAKAASE